MTQIQRAPSPWLPVIIAVLVLMGDATYRWWDGWADSRVTSGQVITLTGQVTGLTGQVSSLSIAVNALKDTINAMPSTRTVDALSARVDRAEGAIADTSKAVAVLRADLDNRLPPVTYRNPPGHQ